MVVATRDRPHLLERRALGSVAAQTRIPERLIVVDDSSPGLRATNRALVEALQISECRVTYLENERSPGASGSWNTALEALTDIFSDDDMFVAILDDDDAWCPTYLERCGAAVCRRGLDMVAADLRRHGPAERGSTVETAPEALDAAAFLVGNPGIQGSNLFARLSVLLAAGGFDEALRSTTDRDICVRIADLGWVRYGRLGEVLVEHFAENDRVRLSTRGAAAKLEGLSEFWRKHAGRMQDDQRAAFVARATQRFDWVAPELSLLPGAPAVEVTQRFALVLGLLASPEEPGALRMVVRQLANCRDRVSVRLEVVLFEDRPLCASSDLLGGAAQMLRDAGIGCFCFTRDCQEKIGGTIATCCEAVARSRSGTDVWIVERRLCAGAETPLDQEITAILRDLGATRWAVRTHPTPEIKESEALQRWITRERATTAEHCIRRGRAPGELRVLGAGCEAVVLTDGRTVYKFFDNWHRRMPRWQVDFLRGQVSRWAGVPGLYVLREVADEGPWLVLAYDFEASNPYAGGHEHEIIDLVNGCSAAGIVCGNIHPKNLVLAASGVKLIDYGADIGAWSPIGLEHMARRAYLACHHPTHPELARLMRWSLTDIEAPEFATYAAFRARLDDAPRVGQVAGSTIDSEACLPSVPLGIRSALYVGVITSNPTALLGLLHDLGGMARGHTVTRLVTVVLDNACPADTLEPVVRVAREAGLEVAVVRAAQQREDAADGAFGRLFGERPEGKVGIAAARTMLQRYVGALMEEDPGSFAWILDDDMRLDERVRGYLRWLPSLRDAGIDVLMGAYEGVSPNPPINGLRTQLLDIFANLVWLQNLPERAALPDRSAENAASRGRFPDYYYDLSRRHTAHLESPFWIEPVVAGETVFEARGRLLAGAVGVLEGSSITRAIAVSVPTNPVAAARESVNRGGNTFVLDHRALTRTPNLITRVQGREARRSDMMWAILNRHYRRMCVRQVAFPVRHTARGTGGPRLDVEKVQGEIAGSSLYAGITDFLGARPDHELSFSPEEVEEIERLTKVHRARRLRRMAQNIRRIVGLREAIRGTARPGELNELLGYLDAWFVPGLFEQIRDGVLETGGLELATFLRGLRASADDYAASKVSTDFIHAQLRARGGT